MYTAYSTTSELYHFGYSEKCELIKLNLLDASYHLYDSEHKYPSNLLFCLICQDAYFLQISFSTIFL